MAPLRDVICFGSVLALGVSLGVALLQCWLGRKS